MHCLFCTILPEFFVTRNKGVIGLNNNNEVIKGKDYGSEKIRCVVLEESGIRIHDEEIGAVTRPAVVESGIFVFFVHDASERHPFKQGRER